MRMCGYARVSTDEERQLDSLEHQMEFFSDFAKQNGHHLVNVYTDEGITGRQLKKRDAFNKMLSDSKLGLFDLLVVKDVSRFARNTVDLLTSIRQLKSRGIDVILSITARKCLANRSSSSRCSALWRRRKAQTCLSESSSGRILHQRKEEYRREFSDMTGLITSLWKSTRGKRRSSEKSIISTSTRDLDAALSPSHLAKSR